MSQIKELTPEQEAKIPEYINKWVANAQQPVDKTKCDNAVKAIYKNMSKDEPLIVYGDSPWSCINLAWLFLNQFNKENNIEQLHSQLDFQLYSQLGSQLNSQLRSQLDSLLGSLLGSQLYSQLDSQLYSQLRSRLRSQLHSPLYSQLDSQLYSQLDSQLGLIKDTPVLADNLRLVSDSEYVVTWWSIWAGWYDYAKFIGVKFDDETYNLFMNFVEQVHFIIPFDGICFISEKPKEINWLGDKLHADGKAAVKYTDGYSLHSLNGVSVPEKLALTPSHELTLDYYKELESADHKIEFVAKYGVERMKALGKVLDSYKNYEGHEYWDRYIFGKSKYELIDMSSVYNNDAEAIFLGMVHQGNGMYIMECVGSGIKTIKQALESRIEEDLSDYECAGFH